MASSNAALLSEADMAKLFQEASMGDMGKQFLHQSVQNAEILHSIFGRDRHDALAPGATDDPQAALAHVMHIMSVYTKAAASSSASKLLKAAAPLKAIGRSIMGLLPAAAPNLDNSNSKLQLARHASSTRILESLGGLASRLTSLLQPQQQLTPQQLEDLTDIAEAVLNVIGTLGTAWPQNIFKAKAFEQCLQPWVDLAAALPAALKAADADSAADDDAPRSRISDITGRSILPGLSLTGTAFAHNITKAPGADKGIITPTSQAMRRLCSSDSLHKVLAWNFALATLMKHRQARGTFQVTAFFEGAERSSSRVKQLQIPAHHQQLLSELGVTTDSPPSMLQHVYGSSATQHDAAWAMYPICDFLTPKSVKDTPVAVRQLPAVIGSRSCSANSSSGCASSGMSTSHPGPTSISAPASSSSPFGWHGSIHRDTTAITCSISSKQQWALDLLLTAIEWICLGSEAEPQATVAVLAMLDRGSALLYTPDTTTGCRVMPTAAAVPLMRSVTQLLLPAVLYLLRSTAATSAQTRKELLFCLVRFYDVLLTQVEAQDLAACISSEATAVAVAIEAIVRAHLTKSMTAFEGVSHPDDDLRVFSMTQCTYRIVLGWQKLLRSYSRGASNISSGEIVLGVAGVKSKHPPQIVGVLASLLSTCWKCAATVVHNWSRQQQRTLGELAIALNQAAVTAELGCWLGNIATAQQAFQAATECTSRPVRRSSSSQRGDMVTWAVLVARSLLLVSDTALKAYDVVGRAIVSGDPLRAPDVNVFFNVSVPLHLLAPACLEMLVWLKGQLLGMAWLAHVTSSSAESRSTATAAAAVGVVDVLQLLLQQQAAAAAAAQELDDSCIVTTKAMRQLQQEEEGVPIERMVAAGISTGSVTDDNLKRMWNCCWKGIQQFCSSVCDQLPLSSCCNNPGCLDLDKLSEQQLVGGKGCVCGGCGVARYCSAECQKQHWKRHKPVCKRLQAENRS